MSDLNSLLVILEVKGLVKRLPGMHFSLSGGTGPETAS
ncbi:hypothetical protein LJC36_06520 [Desulfovibrio sp. OttesenSCG-928-C14]|nr:hypothetical protein [Desulfovibrio sp. OttesenSCG-928-C14]